MLKRKNQKYTAALISVAIICLNSCAKTNYEYHCPIYPKAGEKVAEELVQISFEQAPFLWQWLEKINKLRQELELCK